MNGNIYKNAYLDAKKNYVILNKKSYKKKKINEKYILYV